jgi:lipopolysaccharide export system ATP-binding protein
MQSCSGVACQGPDRRAHAEQLLETFGLSAIGRQRASELSGGERRRLELARVIAIQPRVVLLDEPFAGLDRGAVELLSEKIVELSGAGVAVLMAEHRVQQALTIARRACILSAGQIARVGRSRRSGRGR